MGGDEITMGDEKYLLFNEHQLLGIVQMSKIKLVIFDLDGVLVEAKNIHYEALNEALGDKYAISWNEHLSTYDGLKTVQKLDMLTEQKRSTTKYT